MAASGKTSILVKVVFNDLPKISPELHDGAVKLVSKAGYDVEAAGKARAPVLTGTLRRSIHTVLSKGGLQAVVGPSVDYGIYPEFGTRHQSAHPYMRPAAELVLPRFAEAMKHLVKGLGR